MKKIIIVPCLIFFFACLCANISLAQSTSADSLKQYVGTYKMKDGAPFETYKITFADGAISGEADSYGANKLVKKGEDKFQSTSSYASVFTFIRNTDKKITGFKMEIQGNEIFADKQ